MKSFFENTDYQKKRKRTTYQVNLSKIDKESFNLVDYWKFKINKNIYNKNLSDKKGKDVYQSDIITDPLLRQLYFEREEGTVNECVPFVWSANIEYEYQYLQNTCSDVTKPGKLPNCFYRSVSKKSWAERTNEADFYKTDDDDLNKHFQKNNLASKAIGTDYDDSLVADDFQEERCKLIFALDKAKREIERLKRRITDHPKSCMVCTLDRNSVTNYCTCSYQMCNICIQQLYENSTIFVCPGCRKSMNPEKCGIDFFHLVDNDNDDNDNDNDSDEDDDDDAVDEEEEAFLT